MRILSIDGSINDIGIALIEDGKYIDSYTYHSTATDTKEVKLSKIAIHFRNYDYEYDIAITELPDSFVRFGKFGIKNFKSLQSLHMAIGSIVGAISLCEKPVIFITPREWKKRGSKIMTQLVVKQITGKSFNTHESDAILMGIVFMKYYKYKYEAIQNV